MFFLPLKIWSSRTIQTYVSPKKLTASTTLARESDSCNLPAVSHNFLFAAVISFHLLLLAVYFEYFKVRKRYTAHVAHKKQCTFIIFISGMTRCLYNKCFYRSESSSVFFTLVFSPLGLFAAAPVFSPVRSFSLQFFPRQYFSRHSLRKGIKWWQFAEEYNWLGFVCYSLIWFELVRIGLDGICTCS